MKKNAVILLTIIVLLCCLAFSVSIGVFTNGLYKNEKLEREEIIQENIFVQSNEPIDEDSLFANSILGTRQEAFFKQLEWATIAKDSEDAIFVDWEEAMGYPIGEYAYLFTSGSGIYDGVTVFIGCADSADKTISWQQCLDNHLDILAINISADSAAAKNIFHINNHDSTLEAIKAHFGEPFWHETDNNNETVLIYSYEDIISSVRIIKNENGGFDINIIAGSGEE